MAKFKIINIHTPTHPVGSNINYRESVNNTAYNSIFFNNFREKDI